MNVVYYPTSDTEEAQLFKCCTVPQNILTPNSQLHAKDKFLTAA